jgi:hypothetical protein
MRGVRSLEALSKHGSTSRVLNLHRAHELHARDPAHGLQRFFHDPALNRAMIIKHRLRTDEVYLMPRAKKVVTKIVFPFTKDDLRTGGRAIFVGQTGYKQVLAELIGPETPDTRRDTEVLTLLNKLPSLDPFLVREHLRRHGHYPADCYFDISAADLDRMQAFAREEMRALIAMAFAGSATTSDEATTDLVRKMVDALLSSDADEKLDPLRVTLGLEGSAFREGVFSWKGFIYYKWQLAENTPLLMQVIAQIDQVAPTGRADGATKERIANLRQSIKLKIKEAVKASNAIMALYDDAFNDLVGRSHAAAFRRFLLEAPRLFMELGHMMGVISHIASFWRYRFPTTASLEMEASEFADMLGEFESSLTNDTPR